MALRKLKKQGCSFVPDLLGYEEREQDDERFVPEGYITYVVWEKIPGESLDYENFWAKKTAERSATSSEHNSEWRTRTFALILFVVPKVNLDGLLGKS